LAAVAVVLVVLAVAVAVPAAADAAAAAVAARLPEPDSFINSNHTGTAFEPSLFFCFQPPRKFHLSKGGVARNLRVARV
jgi:hypothetical protein